MWCAYLGTGSYCLLHLAWISTSGQPHQARYICSLPLHQKKEPLFPLWAVIKSVNRGRPVVLPGSSVRPEIAGEICVPRPGTIQLRSPLPGLHPRLDRAKEEAESFLSMSRCTAASRSTKGMGKQRAKTKIKNHTVPKCFIQRSGTIQPAGLGSPAVLSTRIAQVPITERAMGVDWTGPLNS